MINGIEWKYNEQAAIEKALEVAKRFDGDKSFALLAAAGRILYLEWVLEQTEAALARERGLTLEQLDSLRDGVYDTQWHRGYEISTA